MLVNKFPMAEHTLALSLESLVMKYTENPTISTILSLWNDIYSGNTQAPKANLSPSRETYIYIYM